MKKPEIHMKKDSIFNKWGCSNLMAACRRIQIDPYVSPCTKKIISQWTKDLNIRPDPLILIEQKVGNNLVLMGTGKDFLNKTLMAQVLKPKN